MLYETNKNYVKKVLAYRKKQDQLRQEIEELESKKDRLKYPSFDKIFKPLFEKMKEAYGADRIDTYGPFGLCCSRSAYFMKTSKDDKEGKILGSICLVSRSDGFAIRNENETKGSYKEGTLGDMNGMNHPEIEITEATDFKWLLEFCKRK